MVEQPRRFNRFQKGSRSTKNDCDGVENTADLRVFSAPSRVLTSSPPKIIPSSTSREPHRKVRLSSALVPACQVIRIKITSPCRLISFSSLSHLQYFFPVDERASIVITHTPTVPFSRTHRKPPPFPPLHTEGSTSQHVFTPPHSTLRSTNSCTLHPTRLPTSFQYNSKDVCHHRFQPPLPDHCRGEDPHGQGGPHH